MNGKSITALAIGLIFGGVGGYYLGTTRSSTTTSSGAKPSSEASDPGALAIGTAKSTEPVPTAFDTTVIQLPLVEDCDLSALIAMIQCKTFEANPESGGLQFTIGHPLVHDPARAEMRVTLRSKKATAREFLDEVAAQTGIRYSIHPCAVLWGTSDPTEGEQNGSDEPATVPDSGPEGEGIPESETEDPFQ